MTKNPKVNSTTDTSISVKCSTSYLSIFRGESTNLTARRFQLVLFRYHVMLAEVKKQANKENKKQIESEASKAHELMFNIAKHINVYTEDYKHIRTLMELREEMDWFSMKSKLVFLSIVMINFTR